MGWLSGRVAARRGDFVRFVDEAHQTIHVHELVQRGAQRRCCGSAVAEE